MSEVEGVQHQGTFRWWELVQLATRLMREESLVFLFLTGATRRARIEAGGYNLGTASKLRSQ